MRLEDDDYMNGYTEGIIEEVKHCLKDNTYKYALLLDGAWGIGKTHFVKKVLIPALEANSSYTNLTTKFISVYGCSSKEDIRSTILETIMSDYIDVLINNNFTTNTHSAKKAKRTKHIKTGLSFIGYSASIFLAKKGIDIMGFSNNKIHTG